MSRKRRRDTRSVTDVATPKIVREAFREVGNRNWSRSRSPRRRRRRRRERTVRGERQACTRDRESQQPATCDTLVYTHRRFWRAQSALAARRRRPIDADHSRPPRTTLTLTSIMRNYVLSRGIHAYVYDVFVRSGRGGEREEGGRDFAHGPTVDSLENEGGLEKFRNETLSFCTSHTLLN